MGSQWNTDERIEIPAISLGGALFTPRPYHLFAQHTQATEDGVGGSDKVDFLIEQRGDVDGYP